MAGPKGTIARGALEALTDIGDDLAWDKTKPMIERALEFLKKPIEPLDRVTITEHRIGSERGVGEVLDISSDGNTATVAFPEIGEKFYYNTDDLIPHTDNPDLNFEIENMYPDFRAAPEAFGMEPGLNLPRKIRDGYLEMQAFLRNQSIPPEEVGESDIIDFISAKLIDELPEGDAGTRLISEVLDFNR